MRRDEPILLLFLGFWFVFACNLDFLWTERRATDAEQETVFWGEMEYLYGFGAPSQDHQWSFWKRRYCVFQQKLEIVPTVLRSCREDPKYKSAAT